MNTTWKHIRRSPYQSIVAIVVMTIMLYVASVFLIVALQSQAVLSYFETRPQIIIFFKDGTKSADVDKIKKSLIATGMATSLKYVSKEQALEYYREQNKKDPLLLEMVTADILPASLEISAKEAGDLKELYEQIKKIPQVEEVNFQKETVDELINWTNNLRKAGIEFLSILTFAAILVILTIISIKIALRKEEIEILKLLGASNWYVRFPFMLEGMFYGFTGALFAWIAILLRSWRLIPTLSNLPAGIPVIPPSPLNLLLLLAVMSSIGTLVGVIGSLLAVKRYLK